MSESKPERVPRTAPFGAGLLDTSVIVITRSAGGWRVTGVLYRQSGSPPQVHQSWPQRWSTSTGPASLQREWDHLAGRILKESYGNGITYELEGFEVDDPLHIERLVNARNAEIVASSHGPLGEIAGTFNAEWSLEFADMPFVVLTNEDNQLILVAGRPGLADSTVIGPHGSALQGALLRSTAHWQRNGADSWDLEAPGIYRIVWSTGAARLEVRPNREFLVDRDAVAD